MFAINKTFIRALRRGFEPTGVSTGGERSLHSATMLASKSLVFRRIYINSWSRVCLVLSRLTAVRARSSSRVNRQKKNTSSALNSKSPNTRGIYVSTVSIIVRYIKICHCPLHQNSTFCPLLYIKIRLCPWYQNSTLSVISKQNT